MKRLTAFVLVLALCLPSFSPLTAFAATASGALTGPSSAKVGDTITLSFSVSGQGLLAVSGELAYDSNLVTLVSVTKTIADPWLLECNDNVFLAYDNNLTSPVSSNTVLFTATFQIKATAPVDSVISISCVNVLASDGKQDLEIGTVKYSAKAHKYTSVVTKPTCTADGYTTHTCTGCGTSYKDAYVTAPGHKYTTVVTKPTCTAGGYTTHTCSTCKHSYKDSEVAATGHKMGAWTMVKAATCTEKGSEQRKCANCSHTETREVAAKGHNYSAVVTKPTCTAGGYTTHTCSTCKHSYKDSEVAATGHKMGAWTVVKAATCTEKGSEQRKCANCSHTETREVAAKGHNYSAVVTKPTCTTQGYTTHTCSTCKHSYKDTYVNATGHKMSAWTVVSGASPMQEQQTCANCTHKITRTLSSITVTTKPTKLTYMEGESFNTAGMVITAKFSDGTTRTVTDYKVSGYSSTPGSKTITVTYGGRTATFSVTVKSKVPDKITSGTHTVVSGQTIGKIQTGTTVSALLSNIPEKQYVKVYDKNGKEVAATAKVGTGMTVKLMDGSTVKESLTVIVTGDVNGDGNISVTDMMSIKSHLLKKSTLSGVYATAADTSGDSKLSITDFMQVKAQLLGKGTIQAR